MRIFFATDVHGSETCWRKFLNAAAHYKADVLVLGGDMTGKALVPIIHDGGDNWHATLLEVRSEMTTEEEVAAFEDRVIRRGYYPFRTDPVRATEAVGGREGTGTGSSRRRCSRPSRSGCGWRTSGSAARASASSAARATTTSSRSTRSSTTRRPSSSPRGGSSTSTASRWCRPAGRTGRRGTRTGRRTSPTCSKRLEAAISQVTAPAERDVFNFHCPPYRTGLDDAPELTEDMRLKDAGRAVKPVGSTAVREAIEAHKPALTLHGHIHESRGNCRIGRTLCINPGSSYEQGDLLGAVVDLDGKKKVKRFLFD